MENSSREVKRQAFLDKVCGEGKHLTEKMNVDGSSRRYFRILCGGGSSVLMDDEGCRNKLPEFAELSAVLRKAGIRAPKIYGEDFTDGFLLVEDFGDSDFASVATPENEVELYKKAVDLLLRLHKKCERPAFVRNLDAGVILDNFCLFLDWYCPLTLGSPLTDEQRRKFLSAAEKLLPSAEKSPQSLVLWDYHVNNVMYPAGYDGCAVIDFQDAMWGAGLYDLASLIEDERRDIRPEVTDELKNYYFANSGLTSRQDFDEAYDFLALLRHMRVLGRFTTLIAVTGKPWYASYVPHALKLVERSLSHPAFREMKDWFDAVVPPEKRGVPKVKPVKKAMILAAGRGERMRELTADCPKPLVEVNGKTLLDYNLELLAAAGIRDVVVNVCYKKEQIKEHLRRVGGFDIRISEEETALETGGGIKKALPLLGGDPFFVINSDNFFVDRSFKPVLRQMTDAWDDKKHDILLLLHPMRRMWGDVNPKIGNYRFDAEERPERNVCGVEGFPYLYVGVSILHPRIFDGAPDGKFSVRDLYDIAQAKGRLGAMIFEDPQFIVGTPEAVAVSEKVLKNEIF